MKKILIILIILFVNSNIYGQIIKQPNKDSSKNVVKKINIDNMTKALEKSINDTEAKVTSEKESVEKSRNENNSKCFFSFDKGEFTGNQNNKEFVIYEIPGYKASQLKETVYTALSSMYKSPKDVITNISDNMIQLEGYGSNVYYIRSGESIFSCDILFNIVIQFKDGKVRYNKPNIKQIYMESPVGYLKLDMQKPLNELITDKDNRTSIWYYFYKLIDSINKKIEISADW